MCWTPTVPRSAQSSSVHVAKDHQVLLQVELIHDQSPSRRGEPLHCHVDFYWSFEKIDLRSTEKKTDVHKSRKILEICLEWCKSSLKNFRMDHYFCYCTVVAGKRTDDLLPSIPISCLLPCCMDPKVLRLNILISCSQPGGSWATDRSPPVCWWS